MNKWLGWCVALLIHAGVTGALADDADRSIWILLRDKTDAAGRRIAWEDLGTGRQDAELDLPVSRSYLERLRSLGVEVRVCSRWLNAISAQVSPDVERRVLTQDFVREVRPVRLRRPLAPLVVSPVSAVSSIRRLLIWRVCRSLWPESPPRPISLRQL